MKMKKFLAVALASVMAISVLAGCGDAAADTSAADTSAAATTEDAAPAADTTSDDTAAAAPADGDNVINLWSFTDEIPGMVDKFLEANPDFGYTVETTIIATTDGAYQPALDQALAAGGKDAPDIYAAEAAFVLKYAQGDAAGYAAAYEDLGIDVTKEVADAQIAQYTVDIGTRPADGKLVALGYQATGGVFIYRRSIANDTFGTDDPNEIAKIIGAGTGSWDDFFAAADQLKAKGYAIISGDGDLWHAVENSSDKGWIEDGKLVIDPKREAFLDLSKTLKDNGYHHDTQDWQDAWFADMKKDGGVFGFFGPAWLINYTLAPNSGEGDESSAGDWACCAPPIGFFWGGTWVLANKDTTKAEAVGQIIDWITLNCTEDGLQYKWANGTLNGEGGTKDCVASGTVMAMSNGELDFLGGQNMFDAFVPANAYANGKNLTQYDETINSYWRDAVRGYTAGDLSRDEAIELFKQNIADNLDVVVE